MERAHLESEIQQVPPPLLGHPSAGVLSSRGWGVDSPVRRESVSPFPTDPIEPGTTPVFWRQREDRAAGYTGGDRSKTPPPHVRGSESILSCCLPSPHTAMPMLAFSRRRMDIEIRYRLRNPRGTYDCESGEGKGVRFVKGFDTGILGRKCRFVVPTFDDALSILSYANGIHFLYESDHYRLNLLKNFCTSRFLLIWIKQIDTNDNNFR